MFFLVCPVQGPGPGAEHNDPNSYSLRKTGSSLRLEPGFENHVLFFMGKNREECALRMEGMGIPLRMASCQSFSTSLHCTQWKPLQDDRPRLGVLPGPTGHQGSHREVCSGGEIVPCLDFPGSSSSPQTALSTSHLQKHLLRTATFRALPGAH